MNPCNPLDSIADILDEVPDLVFVYSPDGRYLYVNRAASVFLGQDAVEVIGMHWKDLGYPEQVMAPLFSRVLEVAENGVPVYHRVRTSPERGERTLDLSLTPVRCSNDRIFAVLAVAHDVSEFF